MLSLAEKGGDGTYGYYADNPSALGVNIHLRPFYFAMAGDVHPIEYHVRFSGGWMREWSNTADGVVDSADWMQNFGMQIYPSMITTRNSGFSLRTFAIGVIK